MITAGRFVKSDPRAGWKHTEDLGNLTRVFLDFLQGYQCTVVRIGSAYT